MTVKVVINSLSVRKRNLEFYGEKLRNKYMPQIQFNKNKGRF